MVWVTREPRRIGEKHPGPRTLGPPWHGAWPVPSSPWPPRIVSLPSRPFTASEPAFAQITSSWVVPFRSSSAAVPEIVHSVFAPATLPMKPWTNAGPTISPTVATDTQIPRNLTENPLEIGVAGHPRGADSSENLPAGCPWVQAMYRGFRTGRGLGLGSRIIDALFSSQGLHFRATVRRMAPRVARTAGRATEGEA